MRADMVKEAEDARVRQWVIRGGRSQEIRLKWCKKGGG